MDKPRVSPKDVFLHLLAMAMLYGVAVRFLLLLFAYIERAFPDRLTEYGMYAAQSANQSIRWSLATLIIVFPVYVLTTWYLNKLYTREPEKRQLGIRKWLVYLTLFITALIIIGDLVTLVNHLLGGELTIRFVLKVVSVLFVAGSVFGYYFWDLRRHRAD